MAAVALDSDDRESLWLLIAGPTNLPKSYGKTVADKARKDGSYKNGVNKDIKMMKQRISESKDFSLHKTLKNMEKLKKKTVLKNITEMIKLAWQKEIPVAAIIYYTGFVRDL